MAEASHQMTGRVQQRATVHTRGGRAGGSPPPAADVHLVDEGNYVKLENGIVEVVMSKPGGIVTGIRYGEIDNLLEVLNTEINRG